MKKPEPKPTNVVCTLCGLDWSLHEKTMQAAAVKGQKPKVPTAETCVELLKAELARRPRNPYSPIISGSSAAVPLSAQVYSVSGIPLRGNDIGKAQ